MSIVSEAVKAIEAEAKFDPVERPRHYAEGAIECIDAIEAVTQDMAGTEGYLTGQCLKYLWRWKLKNPDNPVEDLRKARWYLTRLIQNLESRDANS